MKIFQNIWHLLTGQARQAEPEAKPPVVIQAEIPVQPVTPAVKADQAAPTSLQRVVDLLRKRPNLSAREIAGELSLSQDYSRKLLKRAKAQLDSESAAQASAKRTQRTASETPVLTMVGSPRPEPPALALAELQARLEATEKSLATLCATPVQSRGTWNLNRRSEVVRLAGNGTGASEIARNLSIPAGEVEFILKVDRLLQGGK